MSGRIDAVLLLGVELDARDAPTQELAARVDAAARAYACLEEEQGTAPTLVACGGTLPGHAVAEAEVMEALLARRGVPRSRILLERRSQDTMGNMREAARLLGGAKGRRVLVVTSDYHLRRALMTARRVGFRACGEAASLPHDAAWRTLRRKEACYTLDLLLGWQDEGKRRPQIAERLFDRAFRKG